MNLTQIKGGDLNATKYTFIQMQFVFTLRKWLNAILTFHLTPLL